MPDCSLSFQKGLSDLILTGRKHSWIENVMSVIRLTKNNASRSALALKDGILKFPFMKQQRIRIRCVVASSRSTIKKPLLSFNGRCALFEEDDMLEARITGSLDVIDRTATTLNGGKIIKFLKCFGILGSNEIFFYF